VGASPGNRHLWRVLAIAAVVAAAIVAYVALTDRKAPPPAPIPSATAPSGSTLPAATYVGAPACVSCHAKETEAWRGSHHDRAMEAATEKTVLGNFAGAKFSLVVVTLTFFRLVGKFFVNSDGPDGEFANFEI